MARYTALKLAICGVGLLVASPALAQENLWGEGPGDIVIAREVPHQNAVLVGEPGRPTLVNPRTTIIGTTTFSVTSGLFTRPLSDLEVEAVRATRMPGDDPLGDPLKALMSDDAPDASLAGSSALGHERTGFVGGAVSGAIGGAGRQIQGVLSSALGRGRL